MDQYERETLEAKAEMERVYGAGNVWTTQEVQRDFEVHSFLAPYVVVTRKSDGVRGTLQFQHRPRVYFGFIPD